MKRRKESIAYSSSATSLRFLFNAPLFDAMKAWEVQQDELVFHEQITTGSFRGQYSVDGSLLEIMREADQHGEILPYYGVGGGRGASIYSIRPYASFAKISVTNNLTKQHWERDVARTTSIIKTSIVEWLRTCSTRVPPALRKRLPRSWVARPSQPLVCHISGRQYATLRRWEHWMNHEAFGGRYCYHFGQVSLGATGFTIKVEDVTTSVSIDITDYEDW